MTKGMESKMMLTSNQAAAIKTPGTIIYKTLTTLLEPGEWTYVRDQEFENMSRAARFGRDSKGLVELTNYSPNDHAPVLILIESGQESRISSRLHYNEGIGTYRLSIPLRSTDAAPR
jgi:alpha-L-fucosidase